MAEEHKKSFMLYFDNFPCVAALDAEQRGELLLLLYRYAMAADKAPTDPEEVLRQHPGLREETRMAYRFGGDHSAGYREVEGKAAALPRRGGAAAGGWGDLPAGPGTGRAQGLQRHPEVPAGRLYRWSVAKIGPIG